MQVNCTNTKCKHLTVFNTCGKNEISLNDGGICCSFAHYATDSRYQEPYYIAVKTPNGEIGRVLKHGRKLKIFGYTFFTGDNYRLKGGQSSITEERTGMFIDSIEQFKSNFAAFKLIESEMPSCSSYPLYEYDNTFNVYRPKKEGAGNG